METELNIFNTYKRYEQQDVEGEGLRHIEWPGIYEHAHTQTFTYAPNL